MSGIFPSRRATSRLMLSCLLVASIGGSSLAQAPRRPRTPGDPVPTPTPAPTPQPPTPTPAPNPMPQQPGTPGQPGQPGARPGFPGLGQAPRPAGPRPYKEVITAEAKTDPGFITVHRIDEKIYFEIPTKVLGKDLLWAAEIEQLPAGSGYGGTSAGHKVVRFTRRNNTVYLRLPNYTLRSASKGAISRAVEAASLEPIAIAFNVEAEGADKSAVIDVTRLYTTDPGEFSVKAAVGGSGVDPSRSYLEKTKAFPNNIVVKSLLTFVGGGASPLAQLRGLVGGGNSSISAMVHYSLVLLPETPMVSRFFDSRVGYFAEGYEEYGKPENRVVEHELIARYRLEKKDPNAAISEPVKPIVYYISREIPEEWHPYIKKGVEDWNVAFEQAGFKNAIVCKNAPTLKEDPDWDPEDARYSVIRWAPNKTQNAMGPHISDPRTGEIISAHIIVWHDVLKLGETWYFTQVGNLDARASKLPLPQPLMGEILQYIVCHEVGHTLGLRHNHKASSSYTAAQLRDKSFTEKYGDEASIMDYGRFNYVAQPGDNARLIPVIGPYDKFAIEWGYKPLGMSNPDDEKRELDKIASRQVTDPMLRFGGEDGNAQTDPTVQTEDLGSDPIEATTYGLKNIKAIARMLVPATTKFGEDYDRLTETYAALLGQRTRELSNVLKLVGGVVQTDYHAGRGLYVYNPVPTAKQAQAVKFLIENTFSTPTELLLPDILNQIQAYGVQDLVLANQRAILNSLISDARVKRIQDLQALRPNSAYKLSTLVSDVQKGVWSELYTPDPFVDLYRRNLQRAYLDTMKAKIQTDSPTNSDLHGIAVASLQELGKTIDRALLKAKDTDTRIHLTDSRATIERILKTPVVVSSGGAATTQTFTFPGRAGSDSLKKKSNVDEFGLPIGPEIDF